MLLFSVRFTVVNIDLHPIVVPILFMMLLFSVRFTFTVVNIYLHPIVLK